MVFRALRHRNFRLFFGGQLVSLIGTWMQSVAQSWLVYRLTGSAVLLGTVGFCSQIPVFVLAPLGGAAADRYDRHRIIVATQVASMLLACALAALTLFTHVTVWEILVLAALLGAVNAFDIPARQSFVVEMVGQADLMNAIALNSSMFNGARILGPAVAGVLVAAIGEGWCFAANAASYLAVIAGLFLMTRTRRLPTSKGSPIREIIEGFAYVKTTSPIKALLTLLGLVSLMGMPYAVLMPIFAEELLHGGARGLGILMGASGLGALIGALTLTRRSGLAGLGRWIAFSCAGFGVSLVAFSFSRNLWLSAALLVPVGFSMMVQMASSNTLVQAMVPDRLRGRVMAVYTMMFMGMAPLGAMLAGALAVRLGAPLTVAAGGAFCVVGAGVFYLLLPRLREEARQVIVALQEAAGDPPGGVTGAVRTSVTTSSPVRAAP
jgi:MFS family permease